MPSCFVDIYYNIYRILKQIFILHNKNVEHLTLLLNYL